MAGRSAHPSNWYCPNKECGQDKSLPIQPSKFKREDRYLVIKRNDIQLFLSEHKQKQLSDLASQVADGRHSDGRKPLECVVVESDWPEYQPVWQMIADRMMGKPYGGPAGFVDHVGSVFGPASDQPYRRAWVGINYWPDFDSQSLKGKPVFIGTPDMLKGIPDDWIKAVEEFVARVEKGEVKSRYTYNKFKALLAKLE